MRHAGARTPDTSLSNVAYEGGNMAKNHRTTVRPSSRRLHEIISPGRLVRRGKYLQWPSGPEDAVERSA
jgi:hypothetical protein